MVAAHPVVVGIGYIPAYFLIIAYSPDYRIGVRNLNAEWTGGFVRFEGYGIPYGISALRVVVPNGAAEGQVTPVVRQDFGVIEVVTDDFIEPWENPGWGFYGREGPEERAVPLRVAQANIVRPKVVLFPTVGDSISIRV